VVPSGLVMAAIGGCTQVADNGVQTGASDNSPWTLEQITAAREGCAAKSVELGAVDPIKLATVCSCVIEDAARRWSADDWLRNAATYTQAQVKDGTVEKCRVAASPNIGGTTWSQAEIAQVRQGCVASAKQVRPTADDAAVILGCGCVVEDASKRWEFPDYIKNETTYTKNQMDDGTMSRCMAGESREGSGQDTSPIDIALQGTWETACIQLTKERSARSRWEIGRDATFYRLIEFKDGSCKEMMKITTDFYSGLSDKGKNGDYKIDLARTEAFQKIVDPLTIILANLQSEWGFDDWYFWIDNKITDKQKSPGLPPQYPLNERRFDLFRIIGDRLYIGANNEMENRHSPEKRPKDVYMFLAFSKISGTNNSPIAGIQPEISAKIGDESSDYPDVSDVDGDQISISCLESCPNGFTISNNLISFRPIHPGAWIVKMNARDSRGLETEFTIHLTAKKEFQLYRDADEDGFGSGELQTLLVPQEMAPTGYVTNGTDCADNDATKWQKFNYSYRDIDNDGYTVSVTPGLVCAGVNRPSSYKIVPNGNDCNDSDNSKWQNFNYSYRDIDNDGYTVSVTPGIVCAGVNRPSGYKNVPNGDDCNDSDDSKWQNLSYSYRDMDNDGYTVSVTPGLVCTGMNLPPTHKTSAHGNDCNDSDNSKWQNFSYSYVDFDNDGYSIPSSNQEICSGIFRPSAYLESMGSGYDDNDSSSIITNEKISSFSDHTCAVLMDKTVKCWGRNASGELGIGNTIDQFSPVSVLGLSNAISIKTRGNTTCALLMDNTVKCWGSNSHGQLGDRTRTNSAFPVAVIGLNDVRNISVGGKFICAVIMDNTVNCWGDNGEGQLGDGTINDRLVPVKVSGLTNVRYISTGWEHTCALLMDNTVKCWGSNSHGQLGIGDTIDHLSPVVVSGLNNVRYISAGGISTCALLLDNTVKCWGWNDYGQLGDGSTLTRYNPITVPGLTDVRYISMSNLYTCAVLIDNTVKCWGWNQSGELGNGNSNNSLTPVHVSVITNAKNIILKGSSTCALLTDDSVKCWGRNDYGQLGDGTTNHSYFSPVTVTGLSL